MGKFTQNRAEKQRQIYAINQIKADSKLRSIFKNIVWGMFHEKAAEYIDCIKVLGDAVEFCFRYLFERLIRTPNYKESCKDFYRELSTYFFQSKINDDGILDSARKVYRNRSTLVHDIDNQIKVTISLEESRNAIVTCLKLYFLVVDMKKILDNSAPDPDPLIGYDFLKFHPYSKNGCLDYYMEFWEILASKEIQDLLIVEGLVTENDVNNHRILQEIFPWVYFNSYHIRKCLGDPHVSPFRPDGPHLIDIKQGKWIFESNDVQRGLTLFKQNKRVFIKGPSGSGKTVLARVIAFHLLNDYENIFYFDCINISPNVFEQILQHLTYFHPQGTQENKFVLLFDNIQFLDPSTRSHLRSITDTYNCIYVEKIQDITSPTNDMNVSAEDQIVLGRDSLYYESIGKGIIEAQKQVGIQLEEWKLSQFQNLWIIGFILRLFTEKQSMKLLQSPSQILTNRQLFTNELEVHFNILLDQSKYQILPANRLSYYNCLQFFLAVISPNSEKEIWVEDSFIQGILEIQGSSPLGLLNQQQKLDREIFTQVKSILIDSREILSQSGAIGTFFHELEYRIPHPQMAIIFTNTYLANLECDFPGICQELRYRFAAKGRYFGSYFQSLALNQWQPHVKGKNATLADKFEISGFQQYFGVEWEQILTEQFNSASLREINKFSFFLDNNPQNDITQLAIKCFKNLNYFHSPVWKTKIQQAEPQDFLGFIENLKQWQGREGVQSFLLQFQDIVTQFVTKEFVDSGMYIILELEDCPDEKFVSTIYNIIFEKITTGECPIDNLFYIRLTGNYLAPKSKIKDYFQNLFRQLLIKTPISYHSNIYQSFSGYCKDENWREFFKDTLTPNLIPNFWKIYEEKIVNATVRQINEWFHQLKSVKPNLTEEILTNLHVSLLHQLEIGTLDELNSFLIVMVEFIPNKILLETILLSGWTLYEKVLSHTTLQEIERNSYGIDMDFIKRVKPSLSGKYRLLVHNIAQQKLLEIKPKVVTLQDLIPLLEPISSIFSPRMGNRRSKSNNLIQFFIENFIEIIRSIFFQTSIVDITHFMYKLRGAFYEDFEIIRVGLQLEQLLEDTRLDPSLQSASNNEITDFLEKIPSRYHFQIQTFWNAHRIILEQKYAGKPVELQRYGGNCDTWFRFIEDEIKKNPIGMIEDLIDLVRGFDLNSDSIAKILERNRDMFISKDFVDRLCQESLWQILYVLLILNGFLPKIALEIIKSHRETLQQRLIAKVLDLPPLFKQMNNDPTFLIRLQELDASLDSVPLFLPALSKIVQQLDFLSLRLILQDAKVLNSEHFYDKFNIQLPNPNRLIQNSTILQICLGLLKGSALISKQIPGKYRVCLNRDIRKYYEIPAEDFRLLIAHEYILQIYHQEMEDESINHSPLPPNLFSILLDNPMNLFSEAILSKFAAAPLLYIAWYCEMLKSLQSDHSKAVSERSKIFEDYFLSSDFLVKIRAAPVQHVIKFFTIIFDLAPNLAYGIYEAISSFFETPEFSQELQEDTLTDKTLIARLFEVFHLLSKTSSITIPISLLQTIQTIMQNWDARILFWNINHLTDNTTKLFIEKFLPQIRGIITCASKFTLSDYFEIHDDKARKKEFKQKIAPLMNLIQCKLNEKYIFES